MIDLKLARELLKKAVDTQGPDFVYNPSNQYGCYYRPVVGTEHSGKDDDRRNTTGCLVGVALSLNGDTWHLNEQRSIYSLWIADPTKLSQEAADYFQAAQSRQDDGCTWGKAYADAEEYAEGVGYLQGA